MIGKLNHEEIEALLHNQVIGRIACRDENFLYIVPLSYAYDGTFVYAYSEEGTKIDIMRKNPDVCFEVDDIADMGNWKSVIGWGKFEELNNHRRINALQNLLHRHLPVISSVTTHIGEKWPFSEDELFSLPGVVFRIGLETKTGKFEQVTAEGPDL